MWDDETGTLYYQVGIGEGNAATAGDHDIWRLPQADDGFGGEDPLYRYIRHRPVFRAGPAGASREPQPRRDDSPPPSLSATRTSTAATGRSPTAA